MKKLDLIATIENNSDCFAQHFDANRGDREKYEYIYERIMLSGDVNTLLVLKYVELKQVSNPFLISEVNFQKLLTWFEEVISLSLPNITPSQVKLFVEWTLS